MIKSTQLKIGVDLDDTVNYWYDVYLERFGYPKNDREITYNVQNVLKKDRNFWLNLPIKNSPDFIPTLVCTKRVSSKAWTKRWLKDKLNLNIPVYQMYYQQGNKASMIKGRVDVFIDDSIENMIQMNLAGVPCLLMDSSINKMWGNYGRVYSLNIDEIERVYKEFKENIFPNFKDYVKIYRQD